MREAKGMDLGPARDAGQKAQEELKTLVMVMKRIEPIVATSGALENDLKEVALPNDATKKGLKELLQFISDKARSANNQLEDAIQKMKKEEREEEERRSAGRLHPDL